MRERTSKSGEQSWQVLYRHQGKQPSKTFATEQAAVDFKALCENPHVGVDKALAILDGTDAQGGGLTVRELFTPWLASKVGNITKRQVEDYQRDYDNWIDVPFGGRVAATITELEVQNWVDHHLRPRLAPKTVADRHALLHQMFAWAAQRKRALVPHNPCKETDLPKRTRKPPKGLTFPEWLTFKDAAYRVDLDAADLILFLASTAWRIGEATALMAFAVDDSGPQMYVTMTHVNRKGEGVVEGAKSEASEGRRIRMLPECAAMLRRRMAGLGPHDYVFTNPHSPIGLWEPSTFRNRWWRKTVEEAGMVDRAPTPHWMRHTHVMLCVMAGMSLPEIQRRLGHEDIKTTINVYGRMIDDMSDDVADRLDALLSGRIPTVVPGEIITAVEQVQGQVKELLA